MRARPAGPSSSTRFCRSILCIFAAAAATALAGCTSSNIVRAPINAAAPCPGAQFLYTDWTERGRGNVAVYRCGTAAVANADVTKPDDGQDPNLVTRRP